MYIKSFIASQANGIRIAISGWEKIKIEPLREILRGFYQTNQYVMKDITINLVAKIEVKYVPKRGRKHFIFLNMIEKLF